MEKAREFTKLSWISGFFPPGLYRILYKYKRIVIDFSVYIDYTIGIKNTYHL